MDEPGGPHWYSQVESPHIAPHADAVPWDDAADFVVVGYGGAGVAAALAAAEAGLSVLALDRFKGGGATVMNGGVFYAGGGTDIQREAGVADTPEDMFAYLQPEVGGVVSERTLRRFCAESPDLLRWMMRHGVRFNSRLYPGKTSYPAPEYYLYHSDSSLAAQYRARARPAARGHRAFLPATGSAVGYGVGLWAPLRDAAEALGVRFLAGAEVRQLVLGPSGEVLGVKLLHIPAELPEAAEYAALEARGQALMAKIPPAFPGAALFMRRGRALLDRAEAIARKHRRARYVRARRGVCLSAGGFIMNRAMVDHYAPLYARGMPLGAPGDDGAGIRLGQSAGGDVARLDHVSAWRFINPPAAWARGMLVNQAGARFADETLYGAALGLHICAGQGGRAFLVLDGTLRRQAWRETLRGRMLGFQRYPAMLAMLAGSKSAATLAGLAAKCGMDAATLAASAAAYTDAAACRAPDPFGKDAADCAPMTQGPFMAIDMSIDARLAPLPVLTLGGLRVDEATGAVLRADGGAVPGLYAAGRTAIGICSNIYVSGLSSADCAFSGKRAGEAAARHGGSNVA